MPQWADKVEVQAHNKPLVSSVEAEYLRVLIPVGEEIEFAYHGQLFLENRRLQRLTPNSEIKQLSHVVFRYGPSVLLNDESSEIETIKLKLNPAGRLEIDQSQNQPTLKPWTEINQTNVPQAFVFDAVISPL